MGFIRGAFIVLFSVLLFISLLLMGASLTISSSLEYENVQQQVLEVTDELQDELDLYFTDALRDKFAFFQTYCLSNEQINLGEITSSEFSSLEDLFKGDVIIPCDVVLEGEEFLFNYAVEVFVENTYYKEYTCEFTSCFSEEGTPLFLISEKTKNYFENRFLTFLIFSLVLIGLIFLFVKNKTNGFLVTGIILIVASLPFMKLGGFLSSFEGVTFVFLKIFFSNSHAIFIKMLVLGIILTALGIFLKFFFKNSIKKEFSLNEVRSMVKKEVGSQKKKVPQKKKGPSFFESLKKMFSKGKKSSKK